MLAGSTYPPAFLVPIYRAAASRYHIPWQILAAINAVETDYGRDLSTSTAGAVGWMQFMPDTWKQYAVRVSGRDNPNPDNPKDAIFAAANLLAANGGSRQIRRAIYAYNHATWYVDEVVWIAQQITDRGLRPDSQAHAKLQAMRTEADLLNGLPYIYGGGHIGWTLANGYDCSGFVSAVLHAADYLSAPVSTQTLVSQPGIVSGPGRWVTIFDRTDAPTTNDDHVIIDIDGQWWESGGGGSTGAASVHQMPSPSASYLETFNRVLHPQGL